MAAEPFQNAARCSAWAQAKTVPTRSPPEPRLPHMPSKAVSRYPKFELVQTSMGPSPPSQSSLTRGVPEACFSSSGLDCLKLPSDVNFLWPLACENCKRLAFVDLSSTSIEAIWGSTFSHCVSLQHIWLPNKLRHSQGSFHVLQRSRDSSTHSSGTAHHIRGGLLRQEGGD